MGLILNVLNKTKDSLCNNFFGKNLKSKRTSASALNFVVQNFMELRKENVTPLFFAGDLEGFKTFLLAIFYIGKGKRSRPYCHLYEAISQLNTPKQTVSIHQSLFRLLRMYKEVEG